MVDALKRSLRLEGTMAQVVAEASAQLGVRAEGRPLIDQARECYRALGSRV